MFRFHKLYLDLVGDDGSVCIAYVAALRAFGFSTAPAAVELYRPDGSRLVERGRASLSLAEEPAADQLRSIELDLNGGAYVLELSTDQGEIPPARGAPPGLTWNVKIARCRGRLCRRDGSRPVVAGTGYADWVELTRLPRTLELSHLEWGRLHLEGGTVVYTYVRRSRGRVWQSATVWPLDGEPRNLSNASIERAASSGIRQLRFDDGGAVVEARLEPERTLHHGRATDSARFPALVEQALYRALSGPTREQRWLSRARTAAFGTGWALHESVHFGRSATEMRS